MNGFTGPVTVSADQLPNGAGPASTVVTLAANQTQTPTLSIPTAFAATVQGTSSFRIRATSSATTRNSNQNIGVLGSNGAFTRATHRFANASCNGSVSAAYVSFGVNDFRTTFTAGGQSGQAIPSVFYAFQPAFSWYNLGWSTATGAPTLRQRIENETNIDWHQFWTSPDQNLLLVITKRQQAVSCPPSCQFLDLRAFLYDAISGNRLDQQDFRTNPTGNPGDPSANIPSATLSGRTVTLNYLDENGNADSEILTF